MTTLNDFVETTKQHLYTGQAEELNRLATGAPASATQLSLTYDLRGIQVGTYLSVDLEDFYVVSVNTAAKTADVMAAQRGTATATHANGAVVIVKPKFTPFRIVQAVNDELSALSAPSHGLYRIATLDLTWKGVTVGYDLAGVTDIEDVLSVQWEGYTGNDWNPVPPTRYRLGRSQHSSDFPSGLALFFDAPVAGRIVRVVYKAPFTTLVNLADDVQVVSGLPATANDIPPLGAAIRLAVPREVKRSFTEHQGDTRRAEEVPPGAALQSTQGLLRMYQAAVNREATRLGRDFPVRLAR